MTIIKISDAKTKSKVLLHASVKDDVFNVELKQMLVNGNTGYLYSVGGEKLLNENFPQVKEILDLRGLKLCGEAEYHRFCNDFYFFKESLKTVGKDKLYTSEAHNNKLKVLRDNINNHKVFPALRKLFNCENNLRAYTDENNDLFKYKNFEQSFDHWDTQILNRVSSVWGYVGTGKNKKNTPQALLCNFFAELKTYRDLLNKYKYKNLPSERDIWTAERLAEKMQLDVSELYPVYFAAPEERENAFKKVAEKSYKIKAEKLAKIIELYKIETI